MDERESFGIEDVIRAADIVNCRCGDAGCDLPMPSVESVVRWQAESPEANNAISEHEGSSG